MSTTKPSVTVICDACGNKCHTNRSTAAGARGDAERAGWRVSHKGDGYRPAGTSNDNRRRDECRYCRTDLPRDVRLLGDLFSDEAAS